MKEQPEQNFPQMPTTYADGFNGGCGPTDMEFIFLLRNSPMARVILPHSVAKQLHAGIGQMLQKFETDSGQKVPMLHDVINKLTPTT